MCAGLFREPGSSEVDVAKAKVTRAITMAKDHGWNRVILKADTSCVISL